jgi:hypothetical protein
VKAEIIRLGTTYGLMSRHTSFVAIEKRGTPVEGEIQLRKVPVAISTGWHGTLGAPRPFLGGMADSAPAACALDRPGFLRARAAGRLRSPLPPLSEPLDLLLQLQGADGSWDLSRELATALGTPWRELEKVFSAVMRDVDRRARVMDRAGELVGQSLQAWATVRTQQQEQELGDLLKTALRDIGGPVASIAAKVDEAQDALRQPSGRVLSTLQELLQILESFRRDGLRKDLLRRAFATALAVRCLHVRFAERRNGWTDVARKADEWLQRAPLGARFWLDAAERSKLLP